ncbi:MAG: tetratricopeptide repeat protein [bacterium]|nr:tetratricopeptide repeat protein [bacterium]
MLDRDRYWDCLDQAMEASSTGRGDEALAWIDEALRANPLGAEARNGRGEILWDSGLIEEAVAEFAKAAEADPDYFPAQLNHIEILIEEFHEYEMALEVSDAILAVRIDRPVEAEVYYLKAKALFYLDDLEGSLFLLRRASKAQADVGIYRGFEGQILFELGLFDEARKALDRALILEPDCAHSSYYMAHLYEHAGDYEHAERLFAEAAEIDPQLYPVPTRISDEEFEAAATAALRELPEQIRRYVETCPIIIEDLPDVELVRSESISPQVLGIFLGVPVTDPDSNPHHAPEPRSDTDRIVLFKRNLEKIAGDLEELIEEIRVTVKHEIGHYLGMDEDEVERLGLA